MSSRDAMRRLRAQRRASKTCLECKQPAVEGKTLCQKHLDAKVDYARDKVVDEIVKLLKHIQD